MLKGLFWLSQNTEPELMQFFLLPSLPGLSLFLTNFTSMSNAVFLDNICISLLKSKKIAPNEIMFGEQLKSI